MQMHHNNADTNYIMCIAPGWGLSKLVATRRALRRTAERLTRSKMKKKKENKYNVWSIDG